MKTRSNAMGATIMAFASALKVVVQIVVLPVIGRVLGPHAYGQIALVSPFVFFSMMLAESGLGACIVRAEKVTPALEGTVFCFSAGVSLAIIAVFAAAAWPLGHMLHEPMFPALLLAMSSILLLASVHIVPVSLLLRNKRYEWMAYSDLVACFAGVGGTTAGLLLGWGVWSLVAQQVSFWVGKVVVVLTVAGHRPRFIFHLSLLRENAQFGGTLTAASILGFISRNIDNVLIGAYVGTEMLGYYAMAYQITGLPMMVLAGSVYFTLFTSTSEAARENRVGHGQFLNSLRGSLLIAVPMLTGIAATAPLAVPLLLGDKWLPMLPLIWLLLPLGIAQASGAATGAFVIGLGRSDVVLRITLVSATAAIIAILIGVQIDSKAVAFGVSLAALLGQALYLRAVRRETTVGFRELVDVYLSPFVGSCVMGAAVLTLERWMPPAVPGLVTLVLAVVTGVMVYGLVLFAFFRQHFVTILGLVQAILLKRLKRKAI